MELLKPITVMKTLLTMVWRTPTKMLCKQMAFGDGKPSPRLSNVAPRSLRPPVLPQLAAVPKELDFYRSLISCSTSNTWPCILAKSTVSFVAPYLHPEYLGH